MLIHDNMESMQVRSKTWEILNSKLVSALIRNSGIAIAGSLIIRDQHESRMNQINTQAELRRHEIEALHERCKEAMRLADCVLEQSHREETYYRK